MAKVTITDFSAGITPYQHKSSSKNLWRDKRNIDGDIDKAYSKLSMSRFDIGGGSYITSDIKAITTYRPKVSTDDPKLLVLTENLRIYSFTGLGQGETLTFDTSYSLTEANLEKIWDETPFVLYDDKLYFYGSKTSDTTPSLYYTDGGSIGACTKTSGVLRNGVYDTISQIMVHSLDDVMYYYLDNEVRKNDKETYSSGISFSFSETITSITEHGGYLAIATIDTRDKSTIYLWDRTSAEVTTSSKTDIGQGIVEHLYSLGGKLFAIVNTTITNRSGRNKISIYQIHGSTQFLPPSLGIKINEYSFENINIQKKDYQIVNDKMHFLAEFDNMGGVYSIDDSGILRLEHTQPNVGSSPDVTVTKMDSFFVRGNDYYLQVNGDNGYYTNKGGDYSLLKVLSPEVINDGIPHLKKRLKSIILGFEKTVNEHILTIYIKDRGDNTWTSILNRNISIGDKYIEVIRNEVDNKNLPEFNELDIVVNYDRDSNDVTDDEQLVVTELSVDYDRINKTAS